MLSFSITLGRRYAVGNLVPCTSGRVAFGPMAVPSDDDRFERPFHRRPLMALAFLIALTALVYLKPQEFVPVLRALPLVHILFVLSAAAVAADVGRGKLAAKLPP